jgi:hypothetical protein
LGGALTGEPASGATRTGPASISPMQRVLCARNGLGCEHSHQRHLLGSGGAGVNRRKVPPRRHLRQIAAGALQAPHVRVGGATNGAAQSAHLRRAFSADGPARFAQGGKEPICRGLLGRVIADWCQVNLGVMRVVCFSTPAPQFFCAPFCFWLLRPVRSMPQP